MTDQTHRKPPYVSDGIWDELFQKLKVVNVPPLISNQTIKTWGIAKGQEPALLSALAYLGLIDESGNTTDKIKLLTATGEKFREGVSKVLGEAYADLNSKLKVGECSPEDLRTYFAMNHSNASAGKMVRSWAYWARQAGWDYPCMAIRSSRNTDAKRAGRAAKQKAEPRILPAPRPPPGRQQAGGSGGGFDPVALASAMADWDADKVKAFFEGISRVTPDPEKD